MELLQLANWAPGCRSMPGVDLTWNCCKLRMQLVLQEDT